MREHIEADEPFVREDVHGRATRSSASAAEGQDYKVELIEDLVRDQGVETVSLYTNGPFTDLCRGPHAPSTKRIKAFKLQSVAGAYWRGDPASDAHARLRDGVLSSPRTSRSTSSGSRRPAPATTAGSARELGAVHVLRRVARLGVLAAAGTASSTRWSTLRRERARRAATPRSRRRILYDGELWKTPATGTSTATTCSSTESRTGRWPSSR